MALSFKDTEVKLQRGIRARLQDLGQTSRTAEDAQGVLVQHFLLAHTEKHRCREVLVLLRIALLEAKHLVVARGKSCSKRRYLPV